MNVVAAPRWIAPPLPNKALQPFQPLPFPPPFDRTCMRIHGIIVDLETLQTMIPDLQQQEQLKTLTELFHHFFGAFCQPKALVTKRLPLIQPEVDQRKVIHQEMKVAISHTATSNPKRAQSPRVTIVVNQHKHYMQSTANFTKVIEFHEKLSDLYETDKSSALLDAMLGAFEALVKLYNQSRQIMFPTVFPSSK